MWLSSPEPARESKGDSSCIQTSNFNSSGSGDTTKIRAGKYKNPEKPKYAFCPSPLHRFSPFMMDVIDYVGLGPKLNWLIFKFTFASTQAYYIKCMLDV